MKERLLKSQPMVEQHGLYYHWELIQVHKARQTTLHIAVFDLSAYVNIATLQVRFHYYALARARYWAIDNVTLSGTSNNFQINWVSAPAGFTSTVANPGIVNSACQYYLYSYLYPSINRDVPKAKYYQLLCKPLLLLHPNLRTFLPAG